MSSATHRWLTWSKYIVLALMLGLVAVTFQLADSGKLGQLDERYLGQIYSTNETFLEGAADRAESMTILLAELHAGLLVLQSSEFGISFFVDANIQLGNIVAQLTELAAYGRNFALFNLVALHIIENLLTLVQWCAPWLIILAELGLLSIVIADTWLSGQSRVHNRWHMSLIRFGESALIVAVLLALIFPLSVNGVSKASKALTETLYRQSYQAIDGTKGHILGSGKDASIKEDASSSLEKFKSIKVKMSEKSSYLATHLTRYVAVMILEVFLLPAFFSIMMLLFCRSLVRRHRHWNI